MLVSQQRENGASDVRLVGQRRKAIEETSRTEETEETEENRQRLSFASAFQMLKQAPWRDGAPRLPLPATTMCLMSEA
jgi:hypothetical protein